MGVFQQAVRQAFNRRVVQPHLEGKNPLSIVFAIPDHPWVDASDGAAVRIAMTVGASSGVMGRLLQVSEESSTDEYEVDVRLQERNGILFSDLNIGANVAGAKQLLANSNISSNGVMLAGSGFIVTKGEAESIGLGVVPNLERHIREYRNGRDLADKPRGVMVIDLCGLASEDVREKFSAAYQLIAEKVKPERDQNNRPKLKRDWWIFGEPRKNWRLMTAGLSRYISTVETSKHRHFQFLSSVILPDHKLVNIAIQDAFYLGVFSSRVHVCWALFSGSRLGVGNDPVYVKTRCLETFPFPVVDDGLSGKIGGLSEQVDAHRKRQQVKHPDLTLTGMYNVLERLRSGEPLNAKEKVIHEQGLVSVLRELHDELDRAVFTAYGWDDLAEKLVGLPGATTPLPDKSDAQAEAEEELLQRLVDLNTQRAAEEAKGLIRWLRPDYQNPDHQKAATVAPAMTDQAEADFDAEAETVVAPPAGKQAWPKEMREQVATVRAALSRQPQTADALAARFKRSPKVAVQSVLEVEIPGHVKPAFRRM